MLEELLKKHGINSKELINEVLEVFDGDDDAEDYINDTINNNYDLNDKEAEYER